MGIASVDDFFTKAEAAVNAIIERFGLRVWSFVVRHEKPNVLHYSVPDKYSYAAYELIEITIRNHFEGK